MPAFVRAHPVRDLTLRREWRRTKVACQACGRPEWQCDFRGLSVHHIVKPGRSDEVCNFLALCGTCHQLAELLQVRENGAVLPKLPLAVCLTLKRLQDPEEYNPARLEQLLHERLPDPGPVPAYFVREFQRRRGICLG